MRATVQITSIEAVKNGQGEGYAEKLSFKGVGNGTYATWTPSVNLDMTISNPGLIGKHRIGQKFRVDVTELGEE